MGIGVLTQKEAVFARLIVYEELPQYKAYMEAYDSQNERVAAVESTKLVKSKRVAEEIQRLRDEISEKAMWSRLHSVKALKKIAESAEKDSDRVQAVNSLNKMFGWDKQTIEHTGKDGGPIDSRITVNFKPVGRNSD